MAWKAHKIMETDWPPACKNVSERKTGNREFIWNGLNKLCEKGSSTQVQFTNLTNSFNLQLQCNIKYIQWQHQQCWLKGWRRSQLCIIRYCKQTELKVCGRAIRVTITCSVCLSEWESEWVSEWVGGWVGGWVGASVHACVHACIHLC